jgi:transcriptional regulator with XRE-family HTH domain
MGTHAREKPIRLAEKLVRIRQALGLSQNQMLRRINAAEKITREDVSKYERGLREPSLLVLLEYSRVAGVWVDVLIDDKLDLPQRLPSAPKSEGVRRRTTTRNPNV